MGRLLLGHPLNTLETVGKRPFLVFRLVKPREYIFPAENLLRLRY